MKTTITLRILFTLAILVGLAAAPDAQTFRWEAGRSANEEARIRVRAQAAVRTAERAAERAVRLAERRALQIERQVRARVNAQVRRQIQNELRATRNAYRNFNFIDNVGAQIGSDADPCSRNEMWRAGDDYERHCEVRDSSMPAGPLNVDAGQNGGISIEAWDGNDIRVRAIVQTSARSASRARDIAGQVQVQAGGGRVYATGPELERRENWSVSYRINVPRRNDLELRANNGGITIVGVNGNMRFDTRNGGVKLVDIGGRVNGETRNGGLNVSLSGDRWDGDGLDVETSNGGVTLSLPENYNAELETRTVNGGLRIDFPITVQGELTGRRGISTTLGSGGPLVRVRTTNGGVKIGRR